MNLKTKQTLAILFSIGGAIGTVGTALLARKAAMKEIDIRKNVKDFDQLSTKEKLIVLGKIYIPTAVTGMVTVGSIIGSGVISHKAQASLMSMAIMADRGWRKYKNQVKSTLGLDKHEDILKGIAKKTLTQDNKIKIKNDDGLELYFEENIGFFQAKPEDVMSAYAEINEILNTDKDTFINGSFDGVRMGMFLSLTNAKVINSTKNTNLDDWGWSLDYLQDTTGNCWVHMIFSDEVTDDGVIPFKVISWVEEPIMILDEDYEEPIMMLDEDYEERLDLEFDDDSIEYDTLDMFKPSKGK